MFASLREMMRVANARGVGVVVGIRGSEGETIWSTNNEEFRKEMMTGTLRLDVEEIVDLVDNSSLKLKSNRINSFDSLRGCEKEDKNVEASKPSPADHTEFQSENDPKEEKNEKKSQNVDPLVEPQRLDTINSNKEKSPKKTGSVSANPPKNGAKHNGAIGESESLDVEEEHPSRNSLPTFDSIVNDDNETTTTSENREEFSKPFFVPWPSVEDNEAPKKKHPVKEWWNDVFHLQTLDEGGFSRAIDAILEDDDVDRDFRIEHLIFILTRFREGKISIKSATLMVKEQIPVGDREDFVMRVLQEQILDKSYLRALVALEYDEMRAEVVFDVLRQTNPTHYINFEDIEVYMPYFSEEKAAEMAEHASSMLTMEYNEIKRYLLGFKIFPADHFKTLDKTKLRQRILTLVSAIRRYKDFSCPLPMRRENAKIFFEYLLQQFRIGAIETEDFSNMLNEGIYRLAIEPQLAVDFFAASIYEVADKIAVKHDLPRPRVPSGGLVFQNPDCDDDEKIRDLMRGVRSEMISGDEGLVHLRQELSQSDCIALLHHEPPLMMPLASKADMLSVRTEQTVFHVLLLNNDTLVQQVVDILKHGTKNSAVLTYSPHGLLRYLEVEFDWEPTFYDLRFIAQHVTNNKKAKLVDLAQVVVGKKPCGRARTFSAHVSPSAEAIRHRNYVISIIYEFGIRYKEKILGNIFGDGAEEAPRRESRHQPRSQRTRQKSPSGRQEAWKRSLVSDAEAGRREHKPVVEAKKRRIETSGNYSTSKVTYSRLMDIDASSSSSSSRSKYHRDYDARSEKPHYSGSSRDESRHAKDSRRDGSSLTPLMADYDRTRESTRRHHEEGGRRHDPRPPPLLEVPLLSFDISRSHKDSDRSSFDYSRSSYDGGSYQYYDYEYPDWYQGGSSRTSRR